MSNRKQQSRHTLRKPNALDPAADAKRQRYFQKYLYYMEGLADYSQANHPYESVKNDHRALGWAIGKQVVALYLIEILLRIDYERRGITRGTSTHNLARLFRQLPKKSRETVETTYQRILHSEVQWTWDVCRTVQSFLAFLGKDPIVKTRYPWQQYPEGTLYSPDKLRPVIYALYIGLHGYPYAKASLEKQFDTEFRSFEESRKHRYDSKGNLIAE